MSFMSVGLPSSLLTGVDTVIVSVAAVVALLI